MSHVDEKLKQWATPKQAEQIDALNEYGSPTKAAAALGINRRNFNFTLAAVKKKAALQGRVWDHVKNKPKDPR